MAARRVGAVQCQIRSHAKRQHIAAAPPLRLIAISPIGKFFRQQVRRTLGACLDPSANRRKHYIEADTNTPRFRTIAENDTSHYHHHMAADHLKMELAFR